MDVRHHHPPPHYFWQLHAAAWLGGRHSFVREQSKEKILLLLGSFAMQLCSQRVSECAGCPEWVFSGECAVPVSAGINGPFTVLALPYQNKHSFHGSVNTSTSHTPKSDSHVLQRTEKLPCLNLKTSGRAGWDYLTFKIFYKYYVNQICSELFHVLADLKDESFEGEGIRQGWWLIAVAMSISIMNVFLK